MFGHLMQEVAKLASFRPLLSRITLSNSKLYAILRNLLTLS